MKKEMKSKVQGELTSSDWRVRGGPRNRPTRKEMEEHEATHRPFRAFVYTVLNGQRTHPSPRHQAEEGPQSRRPATAMNSYFMEMKSVVSAQTISEESVTCTAVIEDRHQNIMSSVTLKKGVEETRTMGRAWIS